VATTNSGTTANESFGTFSPVTGAAPTVATDGQPMQDLNAITVVVDAGAGATLNGGGTLECYIYDTEIGTWARFKGGDFTVDATTRAQGFEAVEVIGPRNARIKWVPNGVGHTGSNGVRVWQLGYARLARGSYR